MPTSSSAAALPVSTTSSSTTVTTGSTARVRSGGDPEQALATGGREDDFPHGKRQAARYFLRHELPRTGPQFALPESLDTTVLETDPDWL